MKGWVSVHRRVMDSYLWKDGKPYSKLKAWIELLLLAQYDKATITYGQEKLKLEPGDLWFSKQDLANRWLWGKGKVDRYLQELTKKEMIEIKKAGYYGTVICIVNWDKYQTERNIDHEKVPAIDASEMEKHFEECWNLYPKKRGKADIKKTHKKNLMKYSIEEIAQAIENYKTTYSDVTYCMNGGRFFKTAYVDYLDINFKKASIKNELKNLAPYHKKLR